MSDRISHVYERRAVRVLPNRMLSDGKRIVDRGESLLTGQRGDRDERMIDNVRVVGFAKRWSRIARSCRDFAGKIFVFVR